jgi:hypothetical protein
MMQHLLFAAAILMGVAAIAGASGLLYVVWKVPARWTARQVHRPSVWQAAEQGKTEPPPT